MKQLIYLCISSKEQTLNQTDSKQINEQLDAFVQQVAGFWPDNKMTADKIKEIWKEEKDKLDIDSTSASEN